MPLVVYFWWVSVPIAGIRSCMHSGEGVCNTAIKIVFIERVGAGCVHHEGSVICGAEELPVR